MDNQDVELTTEQKEALKETLERGVAFEQMQTSKGWSYLMAYYQNQIKAFMNSLMNQEDKAISEFENKRQELLGLKRLLSQVESAVSTLQTERQKENGQPS